jgi:DNA-binding YbaB/EbfC family protein
MNINPFELLKNAQKIQEQMGNFQEKLAGLTAAGSSGGGMVEIELNGKLEVISVRIAPEAIEDRDAEMLQDMVKAAFSSAYDKVKEEIAREMGALTGGMNIPGMSAFPGGFPGAS